MAPGVHGSLQPEEARRFGRELGEFLDFSANMNPFGPPASAVEAARRADLTRYPDPDCRALVRAIAGKLRVSEHEVLAGNGTSELIHLLMRARVRPGDTAALFTPTFGEYRTALGTVGARITEIGALPGDGFAWDLERAIATLQALKPALVFLCSPNNPTGVYLSRTDVKRVAAATNPGLLVLDEAYIPFVEEPWRSVRLAPNVAVLRSMTKAFTLPGLRIGYMVAPRAVTEAVAALQPSWSVSAPAQEAAIACLEEDVFLAESTARLRCVKHELAQMLCAAGFQVHAGEANFVLIDVGDAAKMRRRLLERGIAVRDCTSFGLPRHIRAGVRTLPECRNLVAALEEARDAR